jgi:lipase ATG15
MLKNVFATTGCLTLFAITQFSCITIFYLMFAITIVAFENRACWEVTRNRFDDDDDSWPHVIRRAILMRQRNLFGGRESTTYMAKGSIDDGLGANKNAHIVEETHTATKSLYSKIVALPVFERLGLFENLEVPKRQWTLEDVRQERPFVTAETWSLEAVYCRPTQSRYVAVLRGPQALTRPQLRSSIYCALIGQAISILILASILWWLDLPGLMIMTVVILVVLFGFYPSIKNSWRLFKMTKEFVLAQEAKEDREAADNEAEEIPEQGGEEEPKQGDENPVGEGDEIAEKPRMQLLRASAFRLAPDESEGLYQVWEIHRITNVTERMCWILFGLEFFFLFLWPLAALFIIGNYATSVLFFFVALFSALRSYFNAAIVLEETGTLDLVDGEPGSREFWLNKSRLSTIVSKITRAPSRMAWMGILCFFLIAFLGLFGLAVTQPADSTSDFQFVYLPDFEYEQADDLPYPTCSFGKGLASLGSPTTLMADYAFLAALAYRDPTITQGELDQWFGNGTAVDQQEFVDNYRNSSDTVKSAVSYKLITFPEAGNLAMLCIRGTTNAWDALTDAQLWAAAAIFQALRVLLPLGSIWTPIMHRLINVVSWLASDSINKVAFYKETSRFVRYLQGTDLSNTSVGVISNIQVNSRFFNDLSPIVPVAHLHHG